MSGFSTSRLETHIYSQLKIISDFSV